YAPAPGDELLVRKQADGESRQRAEHGAGRGAALHERGEEPPPMVRRALHREQWPGGGLAAEREALHEAQRAEDDRRCDADRLVRRRETDRHRRRAHQRQRRDQDRLAADAVAEMPEEEPPQRTRRETHGEHAEDRDRADQRIEAREEQTIEDERREKAVEQEVVPLDRRAEKARYEHTLVRRADRFARLRDGRRHLDRKSVV